MRTVLGYRGGAAIGWASVRILAINFGLVAATTAGCGSHPGVGHDGGVGGAAGDVGDVSDAFDAVLDASAIDSSPTDLANDRSTTDGAFADRSAIDLAGDAVADPSDAADAFDPGAICVGLGKVEDPRGCSGANLCDGAGNCVSRFTLFPITTRLNTASQPNLFRIAVGPDGNLWFSDVEAIGRMTLDGINQEFPLPGDPFDIAPGPDGNVWLSDENDDVVGRVLLDGTQREFPRVAGRPRSPRGIVTGPDGNLWFTDFDAILQMTTAGVVTTFPVPTAVPYATDIVVGPDGNLWFTEQVGKIGRITPAGVITEFTIPETPMTSYSSLAFGITAGPDGNLWFTEPEPNKIGCITPSGTITDFPVPTARSAVSHIAAGPDGNIWFIENAVSRIGRITPAGVVTEWAPPIANAWLGNAIAAGPDGAIWISQFSPVGSTGPYQAWLVRMQP